MSTIIMRCCVYCDERQPEAGRVPNGGMVWNEDHWECKSDAQCRIRRRQRQKYPDAGWNLGPMERP